jgi:hypothetical protein
MTDPAKNEDPQAPLGDQKDNHTEIL